MIVSVFSMRVPVIVVAVSLCVDRLWFLRSDLQPSWSKRRTRTPSRKFGFAQLTRIDRRSQIRSKSRFESRLIELFPLNNVLRSIRLYSEERERERREAAGRGERG